MLAATDKGLGTCTQGSLAMWGSPVRKRFEIEKDYHLICGLSLGYPDKEHTANQYRPTKRTLEELKSPLKQPE
jgi:nitroreductase